MEQWAAGDTAIFRDAWPSSVFCSTRRRVPNTRVFEILSGVLVSAMLGLARWTGPLTIIIRALYPQPKGRRFTVLRSVICNLEPHRTGWQAKMIMRVKAPLLAHKTPAKWAPRPVEGAR